MSVVSEIARIKGNIANAYSKVEEKGASLPGVQNSSNLADTIAMIEQGESNIESKVLISTENATLRSSFDTSINGKTRALVSPDTSVWMDAKKIENKFFHYFKNLRDEVVCCFDSYNTRMNTDDAVVAVYGDSEVEKKSLVFFRGKGYDLDYKNTTVHFFVTCDILDGDVKKSCGFLMTTADVSEDEIGFGRKGTKFELAGEDGNKNVAYTHNWINSAIFPLHRKLKARAYAVIERDGVEETIYSKMITIQL